MYPIFLLWILSSISELVQELQTAIKSTISEKNIGIAFSGGVDSTLLAKLCNDLGYDVTLLTIGFENSHDILFAKKINEIMKLPHKIYEIEENSFYYISSKIKTKINNDNLSWNENCIAFYYVSKLAQTNNLKKVITANGIAPIEFAREIFKTVELYNEKDIEKWFQLFKNGIGTE